MANAYTVNPTATTAQIFHELKRKWWLAVDRTNTMLGQKLAFGLISGCDDFFTLFEDPPIEKILPCTHKIGPLTIPVVLLDTLGGIDLIYDQIDEELKDHPLQELVLAHEPQKMEDWFNQHKPSPDQLARLKFSLSIRLKSGFNTSLRNQVSLEKLFSSDALQRIKDAAAQPIPTERKIAFRQYT